MKIKINEDISYDIQLAEVIESSEQLEDLIEKLMNVRKFVLLMKKKSEPSELIPVLRGDNDDSNSSKDLTEVEMNEEEKRGYTSFKDTDSEEYKKGREQMVRILRTHYHGSKIEKNALAKELGKDWTEVVKRIYIHRTRYNIQPSEVELSRFPSKDDYRWWMNPEINLTIQSNPKNLPSQQLEEQELIEPSLKTYSFSELYAFGWGHLEQLCNQFNVDKELFNHCKITNSKEVLLTELRKLMRIYENNLNLKTTK